MAIPHLRSLGPLRRAQRSCNDLTSRNTCNKTEIAGLYLVFLVYQSLPTPPDSTSDLQCRIGRRPRVLGLQTQEAVETTARFSRRGAGSIVSTAMRRKAYLRRKGRPNSFLGDVELQDLRRQILRVSKVHNFCSPNASPSVQNMRNSDTAQRNPTGRNTPLRCASERHIKHVYAMPRTPNPPQRSVHDN